MNYLSYSTSTQHSTFNFKFIPINWSRWLKDEQNLKVSVATMDLFQFDSRKVAIKDNVERYMIL